MKRFCAYAVAEGNAFLYEDRIRQKVALIDGGFLPDELQEILTERQAPVAQVASSRPPLDVVICTHADRDHAQGLLGLNLVYDPGSVGEFWLPADWLIAWKFRNRISDMKTYIDLIKRAKMLVAPPVRAEEEQTTSPLERLVESEGSARSLWTSGASINMLQLIDPADRRNALALSRRWMRILKVIKTAVWLAGWERIRWFEFIEPGSVTKPSGGDPDFLVPVNAFEVYDAPANSTGDLLRALTAINKRSLVFWSGPGSKPGILLTSDCDLQTGGPVTLKPGDLVTVPHHGSGANISAYKTIANWGASPDQLVWVRSDKKEEKQQGRPCQTFRTIVGSKYCTRCWNSSKFQDVSLVTSPTGWSVERPSDTYTCKC